MSKLFKNLFQLSVAVLVVASLLWSCKKTEVSPAQQLPKITALSAPSAIGGTAITIKGINLKNVDAVKFGTVSAVGFDSTANTDSTIHVIVPDSLPLGPTYIQVYLPNGTGYAAISFTVLLTPPVPKIFSVAPGTAFPGNTIALSGVNFTNVNSVKFNGIAASFSFGLDTDARINVIVPSTASGGNQYITVANLNGYDSVLFNVNLSPVITAVTPGSGKAGDVITVTGVRFNNITAVQLGTSATTYTVLNDSTITFTVPTGAQNGNVSVTNLLGTAASPQGFVIVAPISFFIFQDALLSNWSLSSYSANTSVSTTGAETGTSCLANAYTGGYGAFRIDAWDTTTSVKLAPYTTLRFSIYGGPGSNGNKISVAVNGNYGSTVLVTLSEGSYTDYFIPLSSFGNPATLYEVVLQEFSGDGTETINVDNIGLN